MDGDGSITAILLLLSDTGSNATESRMHAVMNDSTVSLYTHSQHTGQTQGDASITDALGTEKQFVIQRLPLFKGYFIHTAIYLDSQKQSVIKRFLLIRGSLYSNLISPKNTR